MSENKRCSMNVVKLASATLGLSLLCGCSTMPGAIGPGGPKLIGSGQATEYGQYAEIGVEFSSVGDFVAFISPKRWKSPIATGGSLSWVNPVAWSDDPGRTGRILLGEAVVVGGAVAIAAAGGGGGSDPAVVKEVDNTVSGPIGSNPGPPPPAPF
jgi:hypothetical protein